jgi:hypothetical protein
MPTFYASPILYIPLHPTSKTPFIVLIYAYVYQVGSLLYFYVLLFCILFLDL